MSGILVTGGTGKTGGALVTALRFRGALVRVASRRPGSGQPGSEQRGVVEPVRFDWADPATHAPALAGVDRLYLVPPLATLDPLPLVGPFLELALRLGVRRVVLLGALARLPGSRGQDELAAAAGTLPEPVLLRPSGFMQNFLAPHPLGTGIRERGELVSAAGAGRLGWIDAADIAAVAAELLLAPEPPGVAEYALTGPEALSYPEAAAALTEVTGRAITLVEVEVAELAGRYRAAGMPADFAEALAAINTDIRAGSEDLVAPAVAELTRRAPRSFTEWAHAHRREWSDTQS